MKISFLSFYSGVVYRGVETYVHELGNSFVDLGDEVVVFQSGPKLIGSKYKTETIPTGVKLLKNGGGLAIFLNQILGALLVAWFTIKSLAIISRDTDFIIATNNRIQVFLVKFWTLFTKAKLVIPGQGGPGIDERIALFSFPDIFVPLSSYQRNWALKANPFVKVSQVIPNGVSLDKFKKTNKKIEFGLKPPIVLCAAALWPSMKRQHLLIKAVAKLKNVSLVLVGDGEGRSYLENLGKKLLGDRFAIRNFEYKDMPNVYASGDVFSFPTVSWESFGIVLVEAMASGMPIVTSNDPIRREIVGDAGIFVNPQNTVEYSKALQSAIDSVGSPKKYNLAKYSWENIAHKYKKIFLDLK